MILVWGILFQHLVDLHNVGITFKPLELVPRAVQAENQLART